MRNFVFLLIVFISLISRCVKCQSFVEDPSQLSQVLDPEKVKSSQFKKVIITGSVKFDNDIIRPGIQDLIFEFDQAGNPKVIVEINKYKSRIDSITTIHYRNAKNQLITKVIQDVKFTTVEMMDYRNDSLMKLENYLLSKTANWYEFIYDDKLMWSDSIVYTETGMDVYNQFNTLYRKHVYEKNSQGRVIQEKVYSKSGKLEKSTHYEYKSGQISLIKVEHNSDLMFNWQKNFFYGEQGITEEHYFKKGSLEYIRKISYLLNGLPELDIMRNEKTGKMIIKRFEYIK